MAVRDWSEFLRGSLRYRTSRDEHDRKELPVKRSGAATIVSYSVCRSVLSFHSTSNRAPNRHRRSP